MRPRHGLTVLMMVLVAGGLLGAREVGAQAPDASGSSGSTPPPAAASPDLQTVSPPRGGSLEQERTAGVGPRIHEPIFLEPLAITTEQTRFGLSSWIAPGAPFDHQENPGGVAVGFTIAWPPPARDVPSSGPSAWRGSAAR
jgi:hypothetical protein